MSDAQCFFTIVRYVADSRRNEAKNVGVLVGCPERAFSGCRFQLSRANLQKGSSRYRIIEGLFEKFEIEMPAVETPLFAELPGNWDRNRLVEMHQECTNLIQFTEPAPAFEDPNTLLDRLYRERVHTTGSARGRGPTWTASRTGDVFRTVFGKHNLEDALDETGAISLSDGTYNFDLAVKNGRPLFALETLSLKVQNVGRVEHDGAWFAHVWPRVRDETSAQGVLIAERDTTSVEAQRSFDRIQRWTTEAGIELQEVQDDPPRRVRALAERLLSAVAVAAG